MIQLPPNTLAVAAAPWVLGSVAAGMVAIPIIIHLLNRRRFKVVRWAAMDYLLKAMRRNRKRLKFEQWLLLAVRCSLMLLFFLGFAWLALLTLMPAGCAQRTLGAVGGRSGLNVFVIDNGYSTAYTMLHPGGGKTHLEQEKLIADKLIDQLNSGGESVAIITTARPAMRIMARPGYDLNAAKAAVDRIEQSWSSTDLSGAFTLALQTAKEDQSSTKNLYILTDGTHSAWEGAQADALKRIGPDLAKAYHVTHFNMTEGRQQWNQAVLDVKPMEGLVNTKFDTQLATTAHGYGAGPEQTIHWTLDGTPLGESKSLRLDAATDPVLVTIKPSDLKSGGPHVVTAQIGDDRGSGDLLRTDNVFNRVIDVASELKVLIVEGTRGSRPLEGSGTFLQLALSAPSDRPGGQHSDSYISTDLISDLNLSDKVLTDYRAVVLCGVGEISRTQADALKDFVAGGGTLLVFMGEPVSKENYNEVLLPRHLLPGPLVKRIDTSSDGSGFNFDFKPTGVHHPFLKQFENQENTGLDAVKTFTYWQVDVPANSGVERVLNYLPGTDKNGKPLPAPPNTLADPAVTVQSLGQGRVIFFATSASPGRDPNIWTDFPARISYVELMNEILAGGVRPGDYWMNLTVGQSLEIPREVKVTTPPTLTDPFSAAVLIAPVAPIDPVTQRERTDVAPVWRSQPLTRPGRYSLTLGTGTVPIAVNVPAREEADIRAIGNDQIKKALADIPMALENDQIPSEATLSRAGNDWGGSILLAVLGMLAVECFLAMSFGHYRRAVGGPVQIAESAVKSGAHGAAAAASPITAVTPGDGAAGRALGWTMIILGCVGLLSMIGFIAMNDHAPGGLTALSVGSFAAGVLLLLSFRRRKA